MRKIHLLGLALVAVFAFSAIAAGAAFAESEWLVDGAAVPSTAKVHVELTGTLVLTDLKAGVGLECAGSGLGLVWEKSDEQETAEAATCKTVAGSCGTPLAVAKNLPWPTALSLSGTAFLDSLKGKGATEAGWDVTCFGFVEDTCSTNAGVTELKNTAGAVPADVTVTFNQGSIANCTLGGASQGEVSGSLLMVALEGLDLAVS